MENTCNIKLSSNVSDKKTIIFFVKQGLDSFLAGIIDALSDEYLTRKIIVTDFKQIDEGMELADICWFEWCDELISYGSKTNIARQKKIICRMHSYEAFTDYPANVAWENVDKIIFVAEHIKNFVVENFSIDEKKTIVIPNGIEEKNWTFAERRPGFNISYVGYINYKKGPMLLLHAFKNIFNKNNHYKLFIAGKFQDQRDVLYFNQMIKEFGLENNVIFEGWQDNLDKWLEDKNYVLCTSILESQNMSVMQAMIKGIKPIIHNFVGAKSIYPQALIWNSINDAVDMITNDEYNSKEYYAFVKDGYELHYQIEKLKSLFSVLIEDKEITMVEQPLVTIGITNYNGKQYLSKCLDCFINQTYKNIEILVIDDYSTDGSDKTIKKYEEKYKNISAIYHSENSGGASKGIQEIINFAKGKYFQWIACDDFPDIDAIYKFVDYLEKNPSKDYVYSNLNIVNEDNIKINQWDYKVYSQNKVVEHIFKSASGVIPMNCLYRLSFFKDNNINWIVYRNNDFSADTLNTLQFIKYNWNYGKIDDSVINYRIHSNNLSHNLQKRINSAVSIFDYIIKNFNEEVYATEIPWDEFQNRDQLKNLVIAQFYYDQIENHVNMNAIPQYVKGNVTKRELMKYCYVFAKEGMKYIDEGLNGGIIFLSELFKLQELYGKYIEEVKDLGVI
ncbi:glycosyltransferase [Clostridium bowmanii]|uniref:glycosyltransferase n=1 Tax=Clostridium bowmanii TaxID=132925 RepID=UPI001C0AD3B7|nr:glycosyltransferase [Clostridium bowmanii]MBU3191615.1 glycosyltransferase [Clostridium bowmanii]MCA1075909.1 glycosyltransferase [Clostridium bowmanii]